MSTAQEKMAERVARAAKKSARTKIELRAGELPAALVEMSAVLKKKAVDVDVYVSGNRFVRPHLTWREGHADINGVREPVESLELLEITPAAFRNSVEKACTFVTLRKFKNTGRMVSVNCPNELAARFYESPETWGGLPRIERISETPIFTGKTLLDGPGVVGSTWVKAPSGVALPDTLDRKAALAALTRLRELLKEFPFAEPIDGAAAVALLMTAAMRTSLGAAPMFLLDKNDYGAGASTLGRMAGVIATGRSPAAFSVGKHEEETTKLIGAALMDGRAVIALDNLREGEPLASTTLAQALTEPQVAVRVLGESRIVVCDTGRLWIANGVNVSVKDDLVRRSIKLRIEPRVDRPGERTFARPSIIEDVRQARAQILSDCFTISAAYLASGDEVISTAMAGFEQFAKWVAHPLVWLGLPDIVQATRTAGAEDPNNALLTKILPLWHALQEAKGSTVNDMLKVPGSGSLGSMKTAGASKAELQAMKQRMDLRSLFAEATNVKSVLQTSESLDGGLELSGRSIGRWIKRMKGRQRGGFFFDSKGENNSGSVWKVDKTT